MEKIQAQANKVKELIFSASTGETYQKTLTLTWSILRETGILLWLVLCLFFVGAEWFWKNSVALGRSARTWYENLSAPKAEEPKSASEVGQSLMSVIGSSTESLLFQAKQQLGIPAEPPGISAVNTSSKTSGTSPATTSTPSTTSAPKALIIDSTQTEDN